MADDEESSCALQSHSCYFCGSTFTDRQRKEAPSFVVGKGKEPQLLLGSHRGKHRFKFVIGWIRKSTQGMLKTNIVR